jgi:hypothetical protein
MKVLMLLSMLASAQAFASCPMIVSDIPEEMGLSARDAEKIRYAARDLMVKRGYTLIEEKNAAQYQDIATLNYSVKVERPENDVKMYATYHVSYKGLNQVVDKTNSYDTEMGKKIKSFVNKELLERKVYTNFIGELKGLPICPSEG